MIHIPTTSFADVLVDLSRAGMRNGGYYPTAVIIGADLLHDWSIRDLRVDGCIKLRSILDCQLRVGRPYSGVVYIW